MKRPVPARAGRWPIPALILGGVLAILGGCMSFPHAARYQAADEPERDNYEIATIGDRTLVGNAEPLAVGGVGLVEGLDGTGAEPPPDENRTKLEEALRKRGEREVKKLLNSTEIALVLVSAVIPPGTRKGDPIDVEVRIPRGNAAVSLRGGVLRDCVLYNYTNGGTTGFLQGHPVATASGPILVGLGDGDESTRSKMGRMWGGGRSKIDMPYSLVLNSDQQFVSQAKLIADRINQTFLGHTRTTPGSSVAVPQINSNGASATVALNVPVQYRQNLQRFLRVVRLIPLREPGAGTVDLVDGQAQPYWSRVQDDLRDPGRCVVAALRLEALGSTIGLPALKDVLAQSKNPLVRFCCAEAATYLGSTSGADELAEIVQKQPSLRAFALTALASLDEAACQEKLQDLLVQASDDEARYGAFRAIRTLNERNPLVRGEHVGDAFWLHQIGRATRPMVHISTVRRAEIVLFDEPMLRPPFSLASGDLVITGSADDDKCIVSLIQTGADMPVRKPCSLKVADVLRTIGLLGAAYPDAVDLLQQAARLRALNGPLRIDALPQGISAEELVRIGRQGGFTEAQPVKVQPDPRNTPNLFEAGPRTLRDQAERQK